MDRQVRQERQEPGQHVDDVARAIIDAGLKVRRALGPGLLESAYELCLAHELTSRGVRLRRQVALPPVYEGLALDAGYRIDLLVDEAVVVEVKAVEALSRLREARLRTYLRLSGRPLGLLLNFNVELFKNGVKRLIR